jgi:hypothetical protein
LTTQYFVTVTDKNNCVKKDTVQVVVIDSVDVKWQQRLEGNCVDRPIVVVQNLTSPADDVTFRFDFGDGTTSDKTEVEHRYEKDGMYTVKFKVQKDICVYEENVQLPVYKLLVPNIITPDGSPGYNDKFEVGFGSGAIPPSDVGIQVELIVVNRWGTKVFESQDYKNDWNAQDLEGGVYYINVKVGELATCKSWLHIVK